jgi:pimeloyl-ACP methyl ester carboxylesterase
LAQIGRTRPLAALPRIACPVWLVNGRWDHFRINERRFLGACRDGRLIVVPKSHHLVVFCAPKEFDRLIVRLVRRVAR